MTIRTAVFVDGYNLYYGRLRGTRYKWLDLVRFVENLLDHRDQQEVLTRLCFCTAWAAGTFASHGQTSAQSQSHYHTALKHLHADRVDIVYGEHDWSRQGVEMAAFRPGQPFDRTDKVRVWKIEEKMTDVNLALAMYRCCAKQGCDRIIVISNDRDVAPALDAIRADFPHIVVGVVFPLRPPSKRATGRPKSGTLSAKAHWHLSSISDEMLAAAQLPDKIPVPGKKTIYKPTYW